MKLSIIVPVLHEAEGLPKFLAALAPLIEAGVDVVVVDGGSSDGSFELAVVRQATAVQTSPGRAHQMNTGAAQAQGDVFMFLHADTRLPEHTYALIEAALAGSTSVWGRFDVAIAGESSLLRIVATLMNWRSRLTGIATGDQAMFVTRQAFEAVGGFPDLPLMEDVEFSKRLKAISPPLCLRERVITSGRRWETRGIWRTIFLMWRTRWRYWRGADVHELARTYR